MEGIDPNSCTRQVEKKARPLEQLNCPRCNSTNTKFCYYNNYSLTQPRYYCKTCRRYWTEGGSLRNVPVGGGSRKNKKVITSSSSSPSSKVPDLNPKIMQGGHDLNLAFPSMENYHHNISSYVEMPKLEVGNTYHGMASRGLNNSLMPNSATLYSSTFPMQEIKPNLGFSIDHGLGNRSYNNGVQENGSGRALFPFGNMKQLSNSGVEVEHNKEQGNSSTGYWTEMVGEGSSW